MSSFVPESMRKTAWGMTDSFSGQGGSGGPPTGRCTYITDRPTGSPSTSTSPRRKTMNDERDKLVQLPNGAWIRSRRIMAIHIGLSGRDRYVESPQGTRVYVQVSAPGDLPERFVFD